MFTSVKNMRDDMGVDEEIARFFIDRKVPENNAFWEKKLIYISRGNGFRNIPVYYDLLYKIGVGKDLLLNNQQVELMEKIMHYAISVEKGRMSFEEQLQKIEGLLDGKIQNPSFYGELVTYLHQPVLKPLGRLGLPVSSLNRADVFLFILSELPLTEQQTQKAVECWYALHPSYLLMDDIYDYRLDKQNGEENSVIELGDNEIGFSRAFELLNHNKETLGTVNPLLAQFFEKTFEDLKELIP